jgi:predicted nucleic acid-binding protein
MVVADASAVIDALIRRGPRGDWAAAALNEAAVLAAPHVIDVEVVAGLRRLVSREAIPERGARRALRAFGDLKITRFPASSLLQRVWQLRETLTPYDAAYVVLAETLDLPLLTTDERLGRSHGHRAKVVAYPA